MSECVPAQDEQKKRCPRLYHIIYAFKLFHTKHNVLFTIIAFNQYLGELAEHLERLVTPHLFRLIYTKN